MNIKEVESQLASQLEDSLRHLLRDLNYSLPPNHEIGVSLLHAKGKKKHVRSNAAADNWSPEAGLIEIRFAAAPSAPEQPGPKPSQETEVARGVRSDGVAGRIAGSNFFEPDAELLRALDRAESRPGWNFVPLKKFRDEILPTDEHLPSLRTTIEQHEALRRVIERRLVLVGKVPNPKAPQFPVTTIRLNRLMPEVKAALGQSGDSDVDFCPVEIRGEPLSTTILRERR